MNRVASALLTSLLLTAAGCASDGGRIVRPAVSAKTDALETAVLVRREAPAFGRIVHVEKVRLAEPVEFVVQGRSRRETDVVLLVLRVADPHRFLPRGDLGEAFVLGGVVARDVAPPIFSPVLVLAVPASTPQPPDALWLAPADAARLTREELQALQRRAGSLGPAQHLPLAPMAVETFRSAPARLFAGPEGLAWYARELGRKLEAK